MREIVVISGKGGAGKSSVCAALAHMAAGTAVIGDLDVDAPDLHILLDPRDGDATPFTGGRTAVIDATRCAGCGRCLELCRFEAIRPGSTGLPQIDAGACEGCGVCVRLCPEGAIEFPARQSGEWCVGRTRFGDFIHARLFPGEENSGRLITLLKREARALAKATGKELILHDGSPGIGCPVISSLSGASLVVAVVEPTPSGLHDFERVASLCRHFRVPVSVIINKATLSPKTCDALRAAARAAGHDIAGELPFTAAIPQAMIRKKAFTETSPDLRRLMLDIWKRILLALETTSRGRSR
ncbi:MAG: ATP-binding protein [Desulfovibrionaceae bacterium]|nr:ATP-binding protein [Desulfovibrionaceae bacterium]